VEHKIFLIESYFRNDTKVEEVWIYSVQNCLEEFQAEFQNFAMDYMQFNKTLDTAVNVFRETGSVLRKPGSGGVRKRQSDN
jgi:hypothetical protein